MDDFTIEYPRRLRRLDFHVGDARNLFQGRSGLPDQSRWIVRGDTSSGSVTKSAKLETGIEIRVPLFIKEGEAVKVSTETREFVGRA